MNILLLGAGLQGRAALHDLVRSPDVDRVTAADIEMPQLLRTNPDLQHPRVDAVRLDVSDGAALEPLIRSADAVVYLLPAAFRVQTARLAVENGAHYIDASYTDPAFEALHKEAREWGVGILPECGLDPGIDLVLAAEAVRELDEVHVLNSYGAGIPEPAAAGNPLQYKISWSFAGVLNAYMRPAVLVQGGRAVDIPGSRIFAPENVHAVDVEGLGPLEAYPNGDAARYVELFGLGDTIREAGRYSMRWPGHSETWRDLIRLGFLDADPIDVGGRQISPRRFTHDLLAPRLQYAAGERDIALVRVDAAGLVNGRPRRLIYQVLDHRDLETGLLAMQRTVGFTASIAAQLLVKGEIDGRGLLNPVRDLPAERLFPELARRGIVVERVESR